MSRVGNAPITVPSGVEVSISGSSISVKGSKGTLERGEFKTNTHEYHEFLDKNDVYHLILHVYT